MSMLRRLRTTGSGSGAGPRHGAGQEGAEAALVKTQVPSALSIRPVLSSGQSKSVTQPTTSFEDPAFYHLTPPRAAAVESESGDPLGLTLIHDGLDSSADIIFVHGLGGSALKTWSWERNQDFCWLEWLRYEEGLSGCRVFSYGYNSDFWDSGGSFSIMDFSKGLLVGMRGFRRGSGEAIGSRPIVFAVHSMGGLVVKKALIIGKNDSHFSEMLSAVRGIMFFSTPHQGSSHARILNNLLSLIGTRTKVYVSELDTSSTSIEDINEQFRTICGHLQLVSLYETLPTRLFGGVKRMIVTEESGVLNYPNELSSPVDADHHTICKFRSRSDLNYVHAMDFLRDLALNSIYTHIETKDSRIQTLRFILGIPEDINKDLDRHLKHALPGSCEWLHTSSDFERWVEDSDTTQPILWLTGIPGSGKSTLAAKTILYLQETTHCQYYFFRFSGPANRNTAFCLTIIAFQLATAHPLLAERLLDLCRNSDYTWGLRLLEDVWEMVFEKIIFKMDFGRTLYWVIDGLDEAEMPRPLLRKLTQIRSKSPIKLLFLSRPEKGLTDISGPRQGRVVVKFISKQDTLGDISNYITSHVQESVPGNQRVRQSIVDRVANMADGSFLWTRLALDSLQDNWHTSQDMERALNSVPNELQMIYKRMLDAVNAQPMRLRNMATRILAWATCSFRPLTVTELAAALQPEFDNLVNLSETAVQICGQFIRIEQDTVSLVHSSARQFLLEVSTNAGHDHAAIICLQYLSQDTWREGLARASDAHMLFPGGDGPKTHHTEFPFLNYAMDFWAYHVSNSNAEITKVLSHLRLFFRNYVLLWIHATAQAGNLHMIQKAAMYLRKWTRNTRKSIQGDFSSPSDPVTKLATNDPFLREWATDLTRLVARFGAKLAQSPSAIHRHVVPFCPERSILRKTYHREENPLITVSGVSNDDWDDNVARLAVGREQDTATKVRCAGIYVFTLISTVGTVVVWHAETLQALRRIDHGEYVKLMEVNKLGSVVATDGRSAIRVWETTSGELLYSLPKSNGARLKSLDFLKGGTGLVVSYDDCSVISFDLEASTDFTLFAPQGQDALWNCPRFMILSPDHTKLAVGFPGNPVLVWDVIAQPQPQPRSAVCSGDRFRLEAGEDIFNPVDVVCWHPNSSALYILYHDTTILAWDLVDDSQSEFCGTGAREMAVNLIGTMLLTSDNRGSISVWGLPSFNLIYQIQSDQFVRDLTFSVDGQRIYDVRGSRLNVWAPEVLVRLNERDIQETTALRLCDSPDETAKPVFAEDKSQQARITALVCDDEDEFYCCGKDDGTVSIHEMKGGKRVRKVNSHSSTSEIVAIGWSCSRRFIASADDSGRILVKRLKIKDDDKWAVYPQFELRTVEESVRQLIFSPDEAMLLISTDMSQRAWDLKKRSEVCTAKGRCGSGSMWMNHPKDESRLVCVESDRLVVHEWDILEPVEEDEPDAPVKQVDHNRSAEPPTAVTDLERDDTGTVNRLIHSKQSAFLLYEVSDERVHDPQCPKKKLYLVQVGELAPGSCTTGTRRKELMGIGPEVRHILGTCHDRLVFLDHDNWVCTSTIGWDMGPKRRLYFFPGDWVSDPTFTPMIINGNGALLCARYGEVAIIRYNGKF